MSRWILPEDEAEWAALFIGFTKSSYRLEGQQLYSSPAENAALERFLSGEPLDRNDLSWVVPKLQAHAKAGHSQIRVRVVVEPPNDYTRFELTIYEELTAAGEDIRIISLTDDHRPPELPQQDYWLFDERDVWRMHYNDDHTFCGAELLEGAEVLEQHLQWRDIALAQALPLQDYLAGLHAR